MLTVMLDSCVYDELLAEPEVCGILCTAVEDGSIVVLGTHIQRDELTATRDEQKRAELLELFTKLATINPTSVFVLDHSRLGEAKLGPFVSEERFEQGFRTPRENRKDNTPGHTNDAIILDTTLAEGAVLVTADKRRLMKVARAAGAQTYSVEELFSRVREGGTSGEFSKRPTPAPSP